MRKLVFLLGIILLLSVVSVAQTTEITGKVTDNQGLPMSGASVQERGTKRGTFTDMDGNFKLTVGRNARLVVSSVGFDSKEVTVGSSTNLTVGLSASSQSLSEVVVTGVGVATSKRKLGISVESITADKLPPTPSATIDQALVGKVAGAQISSVNGTPGAPTSIILRGINTIQGGTKPLILLDGVEVYSTDINSLDLNSIERVEVVQGAAAATIYGAQGANGVIQLFSKKGRKGQTNINFSTSYGTDSYINDGDVHKARLHSWLTDAQGNVVTAGGAIIERDENGIYQGVRLQNLANGYATAQLNPNNVYNKPYDHNLKYYDHFKQVFGDGNSINNALSVNGGSDRIDYNLGVSNNHQSSVIRNNGYVDRTNFTSNLGIEVFKNFHIRSVTELVYTKSTLHPYYGFGGNNIFNFMNVSPFNDFNAKLADGTYPWYLGSDNATQSVNGYNPNFDFAYTRGRNFKIDIFQNIGANYAISKNFELDVKYGINYTQQDINWLFKDQSQNVNVGYEATWESYANTANAKGEIDNFDYKTTSRNLIGSAYIRTDFNRDFHINLPITTSTQIGYDYRNRKYSQYLSNGQHLQPYAIYNINQTSIRQVTSDRVVPFVTYGYLVNQKIDFGEIAGISGGFRSDYSSAFGRGSKPFTFPRGDAYVRLSSLGFWKDGGLGNAIGEFKLRAAYGEAGIQPGAFDRYRTLIPSNLGTTLVFSNNFGQNNENLQVEVSKEFEAGTDISIRAFKGDWLSSINLSGTFWTRKGENVIYNVSAAPSTGANTNKDNALFLSSKGIQASLNLSAYKSKNFNWDFTTNFSKQNSKIDRIIGGDIILTTSAGSTSLVLRAGQQIGQIYGYKAFTSFDQRRLDGTPYIDKADYGKYQMVNGRVVDTFTHQIQFTNEKYALGTGTPKFNMSFINSLSFQGFITLNFQFDWVYKNYLYNQTKEWMYRDGIHGDWDNPVTINGKTAAFTAYYRSAYASLFGDANGAGRNGTKDYFLEDASFVRLRNVALGIDLGHFISLKAFKRLQLVLSGRNIWTATKYTGFDPEINSGSDAYSSFDRGIDHNSMPNVKSYQVGLNVGL